MHSKMNSKMNSKMFLENKWIRLIMLISQQHEVLNYKETISEAFNLFPSARPAILDVFKDVIFDKYLPAHFNNRHNVMVDYESAINVLLKEVNNVIDREYKIPDYATCDKSAKSSNLSGHGFMNCVCHWILGILSQICNKYGQSLGLSENSLSENVGKWKNINVIKELMNILAKLLDSNISGQEAAAILIKSVSQNKNNLSWTIKYIGEKLPDSRIVNKILEIATNESNVIGTNCTLFQSCIFVLNCLGANHVCQVQNLVKMKVKNAVAAVSADFESNSKPVNSQSLIYFTLLLATHETYELSGSILQMILSILRRTSPDELEAFFVFQNFSSFPVKCFYNLNMNILINSIAPETSLILEYFDTHIQHNEYPVHLQQYLEECSCSPQFGAYCKMLFRGICGRLLVKSHSAIDTLMSNASRLVPIGIASSVSHRVDVWIDKVVNYGSPLAAQLLAAVALIQAPHIGEDLLISILSGPKSSDPIHLYGHKRALVLFSLILNELELSDPEILQRVLLKTLSDSLQWRITKKSCLLKNLIFLLRRESIIESQRRRLARALSDQIDILLILLSGMVRKIIPVKGINDLIKYGAILLLQIDAVTEEKYTVPTQTLPFFPSQITNDNRFKAVPIFTSGRVTKATITIISYLLKNFSYNLISIIRIYIQFLINFISTTFSAHCVYDLPIILREFERFYQIETNNEILFKKRLKPDWFICSLLHNFGPEESHKGSIISTQLPNLNGPKPGVNIRTDLLVQFYWEYIISSLCLMYRTYNERSQSTPYDVIHWTMRQTLYPAYFLYISADSNASTRNVDSISTLWSRFNQNPLFLNLLSALSEDGPSALQGSYQTIEALLTACRYFWATADAPIVRLNFENSQKINIIISNACEEDTLKDKDCRAEIVDCRSTLYKKTRQLLEIIAPLYPLAGELALLLRHISPQEVQAVLIHLTYSWLKMTHHGPSQMSGLGDIHSNGIMDEDSGVLKVVDPSASPIASPMNEITVNTSNNSTNLENNDVINPLTNPINGGINDRSGYMNGIAAMETCEPPPPTFVSNAYSWDTLLPSLVHSRVYSRNLYDMFYRILHAPQ